MARAPGFVSWRGLRGQHSAHSDRGVSADESLGQRLPRKPGLTESPVRARASELRGGSLACQGRTEDRGDGDRERARSACSSAVKGCPQPGHGREGAGFAVTLVPSTSGPSLLQVP